MSPSPLLRTGTDAQTVSLNDVVPDDKHGVFSRPEKSMAIMIVNPAAARGSTPAGHHVSRGTLPASSPGHCPYTLAIQLPTLPRGREPAMSRTLKMYGQGKPRCPAI